MMIQLQSIFPPHSSLPSPSFSLSWAVQFVFLSLSHSPSFSPPLSRLLFVLFSLSLSHTQTSQCATLELQQSVIVQHADKLLGADQWYHPIVPVLSPAPESVESGKRGEGKRGGSRRKRQRVREGEESWEGWRTVWSSSTGPVRNTAKTLVFWSRQQGRPSSNHICNPVVWMLR